jgi:two-component sensor histidine kinase
MSFIVDLSAQKAAEESTRDLMRELAHRTKNLITVISAIAHQIARTSENLNEFELRFSVRLQALAGIHDILVRSDWRGATLNELILSQIAHCADMARHRVIIEGPPVSVTAAACQYLGMALQELATNALKYGALSQDRGTVTITWSLCPPEHPETLTIDWIEDGGPSVKRPTRQGFGHKVITQIVPRALSAKVGLEFREKGVCCSITLPSVHLLSSVAPT